MESSLVEYLYIEIFDLETGDREQDRRGGVMYNPMQMDQIRVQQEDLRRRNERARWSHETIEGRRARRLRRR